MEYLGQILIYVAHNEENAMRLVWAVGLWDDDVEKFGRKDIFLHLTELSQYSDFSIHSLARVDIVKGAFNVFDGNGLVSSFPMCFYHLAETALSLDSLKFKIIAKALPDVREILRWSNCFSFH